MNQVSSQKTTSLLWGGRAKIVPIRTLIIGDESTYRTHDKITYLEGDETGTQITRILIRETDDNRPIKLKYAFIKYQIPKRTDITSSYSVVFMPYGSISTDADGYSTGDSPNGYKFVNHIETINPTSSSYTADEIEFTDDLKYVFGRCSSVGNYLDTSTTLKNWGNNPYYLDGSLWGKMVMERLCNEIRFFINTDNIAFPSGTKVEIFGEEVEQ